MTNLYCSHKPCAMRYESDIIISTKYITSQTYVRQWQVKTTTGPQLSGPVLVDVRPDWMCCVGSTLKALLAPPSQPKPPAWESFSPQYDIH